MLGMPPARIAGTHPSPACAAVVRVARHTGCKGELVCSRKNTKRQETTERPRNETPAGAHHGRWDRFRCCRPVTLAVSKKRLSGDAARTQSRKDGQPERIARVRNIARQFELVTVCSRRDVPLR